MRIAFIGLGQMGSPMFQNLSRRQAGVVGFDAAEALRLGLRQALGMTAAVVDSSAALGSPDVVFTMLPNGQAVRECLFGRADGIEDDALVTRLQPSAIVVDMSSSSPIDTRRLATALGERGIALLDAPVSGSVPKARAGSLSIMLGCSDVAARATVLPLLQAMGQQIIDTGPSGSAHAMKALNNYVYAAGLLAASEAMLLARGLELDLNVLIDVFNASSGRNVATETKLRQHMLDDGDFKAGFALHLMAKDLSISHGLDEHLGFGLPQLAVCHALWRDARDALPATTDNTEIYRFLAGRLAATAKTPAPAG